MARDAEDRAYVEYVKRSLNEEEEFHFQRFEFLQRLNLAQLQAKLVRLKSLIQASNCVSEEDLVTLQETLHNYGKAICNYRCLKDHKTVDNSEARKRKLLLQRLFKSSLDQGDPFQSHFAYFEDAEATIDPLRRTLMRILPERFAFSAEERTQRAR